MNVDPLSFITPPPLTWWQRGDYVINPENLTLQLWYVSSNFLYLASLFSTSLIIAFKMHFL